jgi:hypothetical protein
VYGLPKDVNLRFLVGKELIQVAVGLYDIILNFDGQLSISVQTTLYHGKEGEPLVAYEVGPSSAGILMPLLGNSIKRFIANQDGTLSMIFSNGECVEIRDDNTHYECYQIEHEGNLIVV